MSAIPLPESIALPPPMLTMQSAWALRAAWAPPSSTGSGACISTCVNAPTQAPCSAAPTRSNDSLAAMLLPQTMNARWRPRSARIFGRRSTAPSSWTMRLGHQSISNGRVASDAIAGIWSEFTAAASADNAPAPDGAGFDGAEKKVLDGEADRDDRKQARKHVRGLQRRTILVDVPAQSAASGGHAEHQLGADQSTPSVRPPDLQPD